MAGFLFDCAECTPSVIAGGAWSCPFRRLLQGSFPLEDRDRSARENASGLPSSFQGRDQLRAKSAMIAPNPSNSTAAT